MSQATPNPAPASVDVIVPAYKAAATLGETLDSVLSQTEPPARVFVVDDGSPEPQTGEVARGYAPHVTLLRQDNGGEGSARAFGVRHSTADLLLFLDADDLLVGDALAALAAALRRDPAAVAAYGRAEAFGPADAVARFGTLPPDHEGPVWPQLVDANFIRTSGCVLIRRPALDAAGGWDGDQRLRGHADWDMWLRLALQGPFARVERPLLRYRVHAANMSGNRAYMDASFRRTVQKQWHLVKHDPARRAALRWLYEHVRLRLGIDAWRAARRAAASRQFSDAVTHSFRAAWLATTGVLAGGVRRIGRRLSR